MNSFDRAAYMKIYHRQWYQKHKPQLLVQMKDYAAAHAVRLANYKKQWYEDNKMHCLTKARTRYKSLGIDGQRAYNLQKLYGLSVSAYGDLVRRQNGACAICKRVPKRRLSVDHCHKTNKVRGLLCSKCNFAIGLLSDSAELLTEAINYLGGNV